MKILVAMMSHETNTFSPVPTPLERFGSGERPPEGHAARLRVKETSTAMAGMLDEAEKSGADIITPIAAGAPPSGPVDDDAYAWMTNTICSAAQACDTLLLDLHGAMVTRSLEDGEGHLLKRLRELYPEIPIDMYETGRRAANVLLSSYDGKITPTMVWGNCPMLPHVMRQGTDDFPNKELQARTAEMERHEALTVSLFTGFPHADIYNAASGGTMDTTEVLREIIVQGLEDVAAFGIYDPEAVEQMIAAGIGNEVTLSLGAKLHMDALENQSEPLQVTGRVKLISDGKFVVRGPMSTGSTMNMGKSAVLDTGKVQIAVISQHVEPFDLGCFQSLEIDPLAKRFLMLKSRIHYRAAFKPVVKVVIECAGRGVCTSDYNQLTFKNVRRPVYPLDNINAASFKEGFPQDWRR